MARQVRNATSSKRRQRGKSRRAKDVAKKAHIALVEARSDAKASGVRVAPAEPVREESERSECRRIDPERATLAPVDHEILDLDFDLSSSFFERSSSALPAFVQDSALEDQPPLLTAAHLQRRIWLRQQVFRLMCGLFAFTLLALLVHWLRTG